ncbi:MAG: glucose-1-phosphate adenylyltransferase [Gammaproteobacteria bacterium]|jgi:glucose-1-phosphate adenylyltransferase|nr:glucose-1-phosphate adenylyltransferase [Gammaproteobacteria bacterium]
MKHEQFPRFVSHLTKETLALILAGGRGSRLGPLTQWRAKPAVPFGGKFRIIDFPLSNCINSGIRRVGVATQYKSHSLIKHIQHGWGFLRGEFGEYVELLPAQQRIATSWYQGTADAVFQNIDIIRSDEPEYLLVLAGDHIYKMDYGPMLAYHVEKKADLTVGCSEISVEQARAFGVMSVDETGRVLRFAEKPEAPEPVPGSGDTALASMGIYVFNTNFLIEQLIKDADVPGSSHDFGHNIIPSVIGRYRAYAYPFRDVQETQESQESQQAYWRDVGTVDAYWAANMELIGVTPELNLYDAFWPIWTYQVQAPPAKFVFDDEDHRGMALDSMVSGGCIISGATVRHSLLFTNVAVSSWSMIEDTVVLPNVVIGKNCRIRRAVIDKGCVIADGTVIGEDREEDARRFYVSDGGVTLVVPDMLGQRARRVR